MAEGPRVWPKEKWPAARRPLELSTESVDNEPARFSSSWRAGAKGWRSQP